MKKCYLTILVLSALLAGNTLQAKPSIEALNKGIANYVAALQKGNEGLTESAIFNLMKLKLHYPDLDYSKCIKELDKLSEKSPNKVIRLEAYIASNYIQNPEHFTWIKEGDYQEVTCFFDKFRIGLKNQAQKTNQDLLVGAK